MAKEVFIPKLGQTMEEATLGRWLVEDSSRVEQGQEILEVESDKAMFTVEATTSGVLHVGPYKPGDVVPILTVVAIIGKPEDAFVPVGQQVVAEPAGRVPPETAPDLAAIAGGGGGRHEAKGGILASPRARKLAKTKGVDLSSVVPGGYGGERIVERDVIACLNQMPKVTPLAKRIATEAGVDLRGLTGTGLGGKITKEDVNRAKVRAVQAVSTHLPGPEVLDRVPLMGVRAIIAERMAASVHTTARVTLLMEVDATELVNMRERLAMRVREEWGFAPGYDDLLGKIAATALRQFPYMNARLTPVAIERLAHINLGVAVDTERGLLVPVVRDADQKTLRRFGQEFHEMADRARNGRSLPDDLVGGTFTITNLGMYDVRAFTPVINLPEAAILGVGNIALQPVARDGQVVIRKIMNLSLVFDHRLVDGAPAARFLQHLKKLIEEPYLLTAA